METRQIVAYALIAGLAAVAIALAVWLRRQRKHRSRRHRSRR